MLTDSKSRLSFPLHNLITYAQLINNCTQIFEHIGNQFQAGLRNYYNGGSASSGATPPGSMQGTGSRANQGAGPGSSSSSSSIFMVGHGGQRRSTSTSLPRSPDPNELGGFGGTGSVSSQESAKQEMYANIYQNIPSHTNASNHSSMFVSYLCVPIFPYTYNSPQTLFLVSKFLSMVVGCSDIAVSYTHLTLPTKA